MGPFVPSDLIEYTIINYFKHRNKGDLIDIDLSSTMITNYMHYYRKDPRKFFIENLDKKLDMKWSNPIPRGVFFRATGQTTSKFQPLSPILQDNKYDPVSHLLAHHYTNRDGKKESRCAVLFIHGYAETTFFFHELSYFRFLQQIFEAEIFTLELPYHFHRQPTDSPFSGAYFLNGNPVRMLEAIRQSLQEILYFVSYLKERYDRVVLFGVSLGGHIVSLATQFITDIDIIAALASSFLFSINPIIVPVSSRIVSQLKKERHTSWYKILYMCNLKYFSPFTTNRHIAIIGGRFDRIVSFSQVQRLAYMLKKPLFAYPGGHLSLIAWLRPLLHQIDELFKKNSLK